MSSPLKKIANKKALAQLSGHVAALELAFLKLISQIQSLEERIAALEPKKKPKKERVRIDEDVYLYRGATPPKSEDNIDVQP